MEADPINVLLYDIREMRKRLDEMEKALLMLKAKLVDAEEGESPEEIETLEKEALEGGKDWGELKRELGL
jgi:protein subunit release factor B